MIDNIIARFRSKRFNIWTEQIDPTSKDGYYFYNGKIYFGNKWFVFFESAQFFFRNEND